MKTTIYITSLDTTPPPPVKRWVGWRALHMVEGGRVVPDGMPAVLSPINPVALKMTANIQQLAYSLMVAKNPYIDGEDWTKVHGYYTAWCNNNGFGNNNDPRANFVLQQNKYSPLPKYDKMQRFMQGSFLTGVSEFSVMRMLARAGNLIRTARSAIRTDALAWMGAVSGLVAQNVIRCRPGVDGIDSRQPFPSVQKIIDRNWFVYSVSVGKRDPRRIDHFPQGNDPQGNQHPVVVPFIFDRDIRFPREWFIPWNETFEPDPTVIYL